MSPPPRPLSGPAGVLSHDAGSLLSPVSSSKKNKFTLIKIHISKTSHKNGGSVYLTTFAAMNKVVLKKGKEASVLRKHPWIFSGAIHSHTSDMEAGDLADVYTADGRFLAKGYTNDGSIAVKILDFNTTEIDVNWFAGKIAEALAVRKSTGLWPNALTTCFRLVFAEGDGIPGLIADYYAGHLVLQIHSEGIFRLREMIGKACIQVMPDLKSIYLKIAEKSVYSADENTAKWLLGNTEETTVQENGLNFRVNWTKGQKTGFFIDQRENRKLLGQLVKDKNVLNTFCYTGGFSLYALQGGAASVTSVDYSQWAMDELEKNLLLNPETDPSKHTSVTGDALKYLTEMGNRFDIIVLDPPAFAKSIGARHKAIQAYRRINRLAMEKIKPGGILVTFSCSQVVDREMFNKAVLSAAIDAGRNIRILNTLTQPCDHPVNIFHPEGEYLKGLVLYIE